MPLTDEEIEKLLYQHSQALEALSALISGMLSESDKARIHGSFASVLQDDLDVSEETRVFFTEKVSGEELEFILRFIGRITSS